IATMGTEYTRTSPMSNIRSTNAGNGHGQGAVVGQGHPGRRPGGASAARSGKPLPQGRVSRENAVRGATTEQGVMPAEPQPVVRAAVPADAEPVAAIFAHYVATSVATFEEVAPTAADWRRRLGELAARNLPFLVAEAGVAGGGVAGG